MADEAIDHLITKSYDTENLKRTLNEIQLEASEQVTNYKYTYLVSCFFPSY